MSVRIIKVPKKGLTSSNNLKQRRVKSLNDLSKSLSSNILSLKQYPEDVKLVEIDRQIYPLYITRLYRGIKLYQGNKYQEPITKKNIKDYYEFYNKRHNGAYFLSTLKVASIYGKQGEIILYRLHHSVNLLNLENIENIILIIALVNTIQDYKMKEHFITILNLCCYKVDYRADSITSFRRSIRSIDNELVNIFKDFISKELERLYKIHIDGWIYYKDEFHDEILLFDNKYLTYEFSYLGKQ
jgi:hypothetical protein